MRKHEQIPLKHEKLIQSSVFKSIFILLPNIYTLFPIYKQRAIAYRPGAAGPVPLYNSHAQSYYC